MHLDDPLGLGLRLGFSSLIENESSNYLKFWTYLKALNFSTSFLPSINNYNNHNHNYNKIVKSDWLSTALISALIGQFNRTVSNWTVRAITRVLKWLFFHC